MLAAVSIAILASMLAVVPFSTALAAPPANDDFANRIVADPAGTDSLPFSTTVDSTESTVEASEPANPSPCGPTPNESVWYQFTPDNSGRYQFDTVDSNYDTVLSIWTSASASLSDMVALDCNDDIQRDSTSRIRTRLIAGTTYYIRVSAFSLSSTASTLNISVILTGNAGGPYTIAEGESLTLAGSSATREGTVTYGWDVNRDGDFTDATGQNPTLTWDELIALGIDGVGTFDVRVQVDNGNNTQISAPTTLTVNLAGPVEPGFDDLYTMVENTPVNGSPSTAASVQRTLLMLVAIAQMMDDYDQPGLACLTLQRFDMQVQSQVARRRISTADAEPLYAKTDEIRSVLGCGGSVD